MSKLWFVALSLAACGNSKPSPTTGSSGSSDYGSGSDVAAGSGAAKPSQWPVPDGWRSEIIPFPLDFAPELKHTGIEELRFPKGFFDPASTEYWSYAFTWRTTDAALLEADALGAELQLYFRGLIKSVDEKKKQVKDHDAIVAKAVKQSEQFKLTAHVFDAFKTGQAIDLVGWAERQSCGTGALWVFVLAPEKTSIRTQLDELARKAACH